MDLGGVSGRTEGGKEEGWIREELVGGVKVNMIKIQSIKFSKNL